MATATAMVTIMVVVMATHLSFAIPNQTLTLCPTILFLDLAADIVNPLTRWYQLMMLYK